MFKATKPFKDMVTDYPEEPSLRIGRTVPENAVNLAYYYNPTATDAEKILTAEAPRTTIDHRVEEAYRYLFDQATDDDDLFPGSVYFEDEEGYSGRLGRMWVNWYPEVHIETKNVTETKTVIVVDKSELPKMFEYSDAYGFSGNLYLDATSFEVYKWKTENTSVVVDRAVLDHEIIYKEVTGNYIAPNNLDMWMVKPNISTGSMWPASITVNSDKLVAMGGTNIIKTYVNNMPNPYEEAVGSLTFTDLEYEQVFKGDPKSGTISDPKDINTKFKYGSYRFTEPFDGIEVDTTTGGSESDAQDQIDEIKEKAEQFIKDCESDARGSLKSVFVAVYDRVSDTYDYTEIQDFLNNIVPYAKNAGASAIKKIRDAMAAGNDIAIFMDRIDMVADDPTDLHSEFWFEAKYKYRISDRGAEGTYEYSVVATYKGVLKKTILTEKQVPAEYKVTCEYVGLVRHVWYDYDGQAYYRGAVTKGNAMGNVNPEGDDEMLMFSDDEGYLRRPVDITMEDGHVETHNFYRVEGDYFYITDVFKDDKACFFKYPLKRDIYDYRGPDQNGFYEGTAVKMSTAAFKNLPADYKYAVKLEPSEYELVDEITDDFNLVTVNKPKRYAAFLYTSFISGATDTFKATYNAFNDTDENNVDLESGVTESVYNYPFMFRYKDYDLVSVEPRARTNKIKLKQPRFIEDTRFYVTFTYEISVARKDQLDSDGNLIKGAESFVAGPFVASILNKDYAVKSEYSKFDGRAFIISPMSDNVYLSPADIVFRAQAASGVSPVAHYSDTDLIYRAEILEIDPHDAGGVNLRCNPDGSGLLTAETTIDTGFYNEKTGEYNKKLVIDNPYYIENGKIYPGFKVKAVDSRYIKVDAPREDGLLESWYPMIQFGHYSQVMDQYGTHVKVCYSMPEYDTQHFSPTYKMPYMDVENEKVKILNTHMIKTKCYPLHVFHDETGDIPTVKLFKVIDGEQFPIVIQDISFKDGVVITKDTLSENDYIIANYTYVEENFMYRGFWRNEDDFARIDLNPNIYHTYSDLGYIPSETKPSKNLFNKVIYFFMRPSLIYEVSAENDRLIYDMDGEQVKQVKKTRTVQRVKYRTEMQDVSVYRRTYNNSNTEVNGLRRTYTFSATLLPLLEFKVDDNAQEYHSSIRITMENSAHWRGFVVQKLTNKDTESTEGSRFQTEYQKFDDTNHDHDSGTSYSFDISSITLVPGEIYRINAYVDAGILSATFSLNLTRDFTVKETSISRQTEQIEVQVPDGYENVEEEYYELEPVNTEISNITEENSECLYHQIDNSQPQSDTDIYIGSVYIRQNTSLHSTVIVDSRTRGGGVITAMKDSIRHALEPESDFYLDIGFYDGEPYQENAVIIVRIDQKVLKDFGGRFTQGDVEMKVKRWLGLGVFPIIEYVDAYGQKDMPNYNLEVEDTYTNVTSETPELIVECVRI